MPWSTRGCVMTDVTLAVAAKGRSLWADAWNRLKANKAAMVSIWYLAFMALICIIGPWFTPHDFTTIYQDYTRVPPSLEAYPTAEAVDLAVRDAVKRARLDLVRSNLRAAIEEVARETGIVRQATERLSAHMAGVMQAVNSALAHAKVYSRGGMIAMGPNVVSTLDIKS